MLAQNPLADLPPEVQAPVLRALAHPSQHALNARFPFWALPGQEPPRAGASGVDWRTWVIMAGRGFGKTRAGAEWVLGLVRGSAGSGRSEEGEEGPHPPTAKGRRVPPSPLQGEGLGGVRVALIAATIEECRAVMVEGPSGILACAQQGEVAEWSALKRRILFASGAQAFLYSGRSPEGLRGPEHDFAWCDELAKWRYPQESWDNLSLGLRRGEWPRALVTTTPRSGSAALNTILALPDTVMTGGSTRANCYLPDAYVEGVEARYAGTRQGAQELDGVLLADVEGSLWPRGLIEGCRVAAPSPRLRGVSGWIAPSNPRLCRGHNRPDTGWGEGQGADDVDAARVGDALPLSPTLSPLRGERERFSRIVIGVDPPASAAGTCGIVVCGLEARGEGAARGVVLDDASVSGHSPEGWARAVAGAAARWGADRVVVERNQGGDMVASVLRAASATLPIRTVHASRGKAARAEPVAALFETGQAVFAGVFPELEAELSGLQIAGGYQGPGVSPDRADAMVWAPWALLLAPAAVPQVRAL